MNQFQNPVSQSDSQQQGLAAYRFADRANLQEVAALVVSDVVKEFRPTWYTEDWCNLVLSNAGMFTFRFDRKSYLATLIVSPKGSFVHHTQRSDSVAASQALIRSVPDSKIDDGCSSTVDDALKKLVGRKRLSDMSVNLGAEGEPDSIRLMFEDGSFAIMAFRFSSLIAVEHTSLDSAKKIYALEGRNISHTGLNLISTACTGQETLVEQPVNADVITIKLPTIPTKRRIEDDF